MTDLDKDLTKKIYEVMQIPYLSERHDAIQAILTHTLQTYKDEIVERKQGYDPNMLGSWVFIGDNARLQNLGDLYWSYVAEEVARESTHYDHYELDYLKRNMKFAGFDEVGIHKQLARADQRAKERLAHINSASEKRGI